MVNCPSSCVLVSDDVLRKCLMCVEWKENNQDTKEQARNDWQSQSAKLRSATMGDRAAQVVSAFAHSCCSLLVGNTCWNNLIRGADRRWRQSFRPFDKIHSDNCIFGSVRRFHITTKNTD